MTLYRLFIILLLSEKLNLFLKSGENQLLAWSDRVIPYNENLSLQMRFYYLHIYKNKRIERNEKEYICTTEI